MKKQFCSSCGNQITEQGKFCSTCGHPLQTSTDNPPQVNEVQQHAPNTQQAPVAQQSTKRNNTILYGIIAAVALLGIFFWIKDTPEGVAEKFISHMMSLELEEAEKLLSPDAESYLKEDIRDMRRGMAELPIELSGNLKMKHRIVVDDVRISGNNAKVDLEIYLLDDGYSEYGTFELKKHGLKWKIVSAD